jgi:5'-nucleotidase
MLQLIKFTLALLGFNVSPIFADFALTVLHTNDVHARFEEMSVYGGPCHAKDSQTGKCYGGIARRMTKLRQFRNTSDHVILLDAGDQFQGTLWFLIHEGYAAAHFMNLLHYDVMVSVFMLVMLYNEQERIW